MQDSSCNDNVSVKGQSFYRLKQFHFRAIRNSDVNFGSTINLFEGHGKEFPSQAITLTILTILPTHALPYKLSILDEFAQNIEGKMSEKMISCVQSVVRTHVMTLDSLDRDIRCSSLDLPQK